MAPKPVTLPTLPATGEAAGTTTQVNPPAEAAAPKFTILGVSAAIPMPVKSQAKRGVKSGFLFDALTEVGMSFGLIGRTRKSMSTIVSNQNRAATNNPAKKDENGNVIFKTKEVTQADGSKIKMPSEEPETIRIKEFEAFDVDPKTDPEGASCRVFRIK